MRNCFLVLPFGRNVDGILTDAIAFLKDRGYEVLRAVVVALEKDLVPETFRAVIRVNSRGQFISGWQFYAGPDALPVACVMNGGTTPQQWYVHEQSSDDQDSPYRTARCALDVQRDGVVILRDAYFFNGRGGYKAS